MLTNLISKFPTFKEFIQNNPKASEADYLKAYEKFRQLHQHLI